MAVPFFLSLRIRSPVCRGDFLMFLVCVVFTQVVSIYIPF